jgi:hypothetical protein
MKLFSVPRLPVSVIFLFIAAFLVITSAKAQWAAGIEAGYNKNSLITNNANRAFTYYQPLNGFSVGIPVQYTINSWFAVAADPGFIKKNYRQQRGDFYTGVYQDNDNSYIQLPLMGHFMFGGKSLKGFLNAGIYAAYWISARVKGKMANILDAVDNTSGGSSVYNYQRPYTYDQAYSYNKIKDNRFEMGWVTGLGVEYNVDKRFKVFTEARLLYSFTDQQKNYSINQEPRYNNTTGIVAGVLMNLKTTTATDRHKKSL